MHDLAALVGRLLIIAIYIMAGIDKIGGFEGTAQFIASKGLPAAQLLTLAAIVFEALGGLMIAVGWQTRLAALALAVFTAIITPIFHGYWSVSGAERFGDYLNFWKNMGLIGGFLLLAAFGAGRFSLDGRRGEA